MFPVTLHISAASMGGTHLGSGACCLFEDVGGTIRLTPSKPRFNNDVSLTVPYYLVAHSRSNLAVGQTSILGLVAASQPLFITNFLGAIEGTPDFYSWGLSASAPQGVKYADTRAIGVQALPLSNQDSLLVFAINTFDRFSNAAGFLEWDIFIDTTGTGTPDYVLVGANGSFFTTAAEAQNKLVSALIRLSDGATLALRLADVATDNSTVLLPVLASDLGLSLTKPRFSYRENHFGPDGSGASMPGIATFNAFTPALTIIAAPQAIQPNVFGTATVKVNAAEWARTPPLGLMIVAPDNKAGRAQALLVPN